MPDDTKNPPDSPDDSTGWTARVADEVRDAGRKVADGTSRAGPASTISMSSPPSSTSPSHAGLVPSTGWPDPAF